MLEAEHDQRTAVLGRNQKALLQVTLFRQLSDDITLVLHEAPKQTSTGTTRSAGSVCRDSPSWAPDR